MQILRPLYKWVLLSTCLGGGLLVGQAQALSIDRANHCTHNLISFKSRLETHLQQLWQGPFLRKIRQRPDQILSSLAARDRRLTIHNLHKLGDALAKLRWAAFMSADAADFRGNLDLRLQVAELRKSLEALAKVFKKVRPPEIDDYTVFNGVKVYRESALANLAPNLWPAYLHFSAHLNQIALQGPEQARLTELSNELKKSLDITSLGQNLKHLLLQWNDFARGNQEIQNIGRIHLENVFNEHLADLLGHIRAYLVAQLVIGDITPYGPKYVVEILISPAHKLPAAIKEMMADWVVSREDPAGPPQRRQLLIPPMA